MFDVKELQENGTENLTAEELYENPIWYALKAYIRKNGNPSEELLKKITCIPDFMKATMLGTETDEDLRYYEDFDVNSMNLPYEILESFTAENHFLEKEEWRIKFSEELQIIDEAKLFPSGIYECFAEAYLTIRDELSAKDLKRIRKYSLQTKERRLGNLLYRDLLAHLETIAVDPDLVASFTCVPKFMKMTLLKEGDLGKSYYESEDRKVSYENLRYEIIEEFVGNHEFPLKETWDDILSEEIYEIEQSGYFPTNIFICFQEALLDFWTAISFQTIWELKKILKENKRLGGTD